MASLDAAESGVRHEEVGAQDLLVGVWDWDILHDRVYADTRFARMFGIDAEDAVTGTPLRRWTNAVHRDDRPALETAIADALKGRLFSIEYRVVCEGQIRWVYARGKCTMGRDGRAVRFPGAIVDITREKLEPFDPSIVPL